MPNIPNAERRLSPPPDNAKKSAVLVPLIVGEDNSLHVVLTVRSDALRNHKGQISFPGGRLDDGESAVEGALREAHEEIGLESQFLDVAGILSSLYIPPSNSAVTPVVAMLRGQPAWNINTGEVQEVLVQPIDNLLNEESIRIRTDVMPHLPVPVPTWEINHSIPLWGATAMMLNEFITLYNEYQQDTR